MVCFHVCVWGIQNGGCNQDALVTLSHLHKQKLYLAVQILQASICNIAIVAKDDSNTVLHTCCHHTSEKKESMLWCLHMDCCDVQGFATFLDQNFVKIIKMP